MALSRTLIDNPFISSLHRVHLYQSICTKFNTYTKYSDGQNFNIHFLTGLYDSWPQETEEVIFDILSVHRRRMYMKTVAA